jgi:UDP:flavonoid glycosyltransferase YjiC (YdhE family)
LPSLSFLGPAGAYLFPPLCLDGYSRLIVPKPWDWGARHYLTGYWFLDGAADWRPPQGVLDFLADEPPPVCVGFGSMHNRDAAEISHLVIRALELAGQRGVLLTGWGGLASVPNSDQVLVAEGIPHDWLFPRMAAVVHHGGAGTTAAALRAGVPAVVVPFMSDQPFWARRVFALGAGPQPIPRGQLTAARLARAIRRAVQDTGIRHRAAVLGQRLRAEDGVGRAADLFDHHFAASTPSSRPRKAA